MPIYSEKHVICGVCGLKTFMRSPIIDKPGIERHMVACLFVKSGIEIEIDLMPSKPYNWVVRLPALNGKAVSDQLYKLNCISASAHSVTFPVFYKQLGKLIQDGVLS